MNKVKFSLTDGPDTSEPGKSDHYLGGFKDFLGGVLEVPGLVALPGKEIEVDGVKFEIDVTKASEFVYSIIWKRETRRAAAGRFITLNVAGTTRNVITVFFDKDLPKETLVTKILNAAKGEKKRQEQAVEAEATAEPHKKAIIEYVGTLIENVSAIYATGGMIEIMFFAGASLTIAAGGAFVSFAVEAEEYKSAENFNLFVKEINLAADTSKVILLKKPLPQETIMWIGGLGERTLIYPAKI